MLSASALRCASTSLTPFAQAGEVVVRVIAAGTNPGEISIREGRLKDVFPMTLPFGQGDDHRFRSGRKVRRKE
jgi:NADPH:quinone reductase-like Zn-dependent oxidoreductase